MSFLPLSQGFLKNEKDNALLSAIEESRKRVRNEPKCRCTAVVRAALCTGSMFWKLEPVPKAQHSSLDSELISSAGTVFQENIMLVPPCVFSDRNASETLDYRLIIKLILKWKGHTILWFHCYRKKWYFGFYWISSSERQLWSLLIFLNFFYHPSWLSMLPFIIICIIVDIYYVSFRYSTFIFLIIWSPQ